MVGTLRGILCLVVVLLGAEVVKAECYAVYLSHQSRVINWPATSHTWAVYVQTDDQGRIVEIVQINWFASDRSLEFFGSAEKGVNRDYMETIISASRKGYRVSMWGPFRIHPELYRRAKAQELQLVRGSVSYQLLDLFDREVAFNCIHANTDLEYDRPLARTLFARGERGTIKVARHLEHWFYPDTICGNYVRYPQISRQLGLENLGIEQRELRRR
jgi:hypothetical protein